MSAAVETGAGLNCCATAASGLFGSSVGALLEGIIGFGIPEGGGTDEAGGGTGVSDGPPRMGGGIWGAGTLPRAGGGGVPPGGAPIFCNRDLRSIFGFLSSAIVDRRDLTCLHARVSTRSRDNPHAAARRLAAPCVRAARRPAYALARRAHPRLPHALVDAFID